MTAFPSDSARARSTEGKCRCERLVFAAPSLVTIRGTSIGCGDFLDCAARLAEEEGGLLVIVHKLSEKKKPRPPRGLRCKHPPRLAQPAEGFPFLGWSRLSHRSCTPPRRLENASPMTPLELWQMPKETVVRAGS